MRIPCFEEEILVLKLPFFKTQSIVDGNLCRIAQEVYLLRYRLRRWVGILQSTRQRFTEQPAIVLRIEETFFKIDYLLVAGQNQE